MDHESIELTDPELPRSISQQLSRLSKRMKAEGFETRYVHRNISEPTGVKAIGLTMENGGGDVLKIIALQHVTKFDPDATSIVYNTEFLDGTTIVTASTKTVGIHPRFKPPIHSFHFPEVDDISHLYAIHRALIAKHGAARDPADHLRGGTEAHYKRMQKQFHDNISKNDYYRIDRTGDFLRPTWKGAILMGWRLVPDVKSLNAFTKRWKARRMLRELGPLMEAADQTAVGS